MPTPQDPYRNFNFLVEIDGITQAGFSDVSGLSADNAPIEYREGGNPRIRKLPSQTKYSNITLKWGLTDSHDLYDWFHNVTQGNITRKTGSIVVNDIDGVTEKVRYNFYNAWPTKWTGATFTAKGNDVAIDQLDLAVEYVERA